jgi:hypothetical protein
LTEATLYQSLIPRLEAQRELRFRRLNKKLSPQEWRELYFRAYNDERLADQAEANAILAEKVTQDG